MFCQSFGQNGEEERSNRMSMTGSSRAAILFFLDFGASTLKLNQYFSFDRSIFQH